MEDYVTEGHCLHPELFCGTSRDQWLHTDYNILRKLQLSGASVEELFDTGILREEMTGVYSLPVFSVELCRMILEETANIIRYSNDKGIPIRRPNSMNKYGLVLNLVGMKDTLSSLLLEYLLPISQLVFPVEGSAVSDHHSFIVSYDTTRDKSLDMHTDDSDITWNICLGKEGFTGSGLTFCGRLADADHRQCKGHYSHVLGRALIHLGHHRHGADVITGGERHNLIIWCKNNNYRNSELFEARMRHYEKEIGPPDLQCLSYTHDRDYIAFKDYPAGKNPYSLNSDSEEEETEADGTAYDNELSKPQSLPWCPPTRFQYEGMPSQNKLMLIHFQKEVEREERKEKKRKRHGDAV